MERKRTIIICALIALAVVTGVVVLAYRSSQNAKQELAEMRRAMERLESEARAASQRAEDAEREKRLAAEREIAEKQAKEAERQRLEQEQLSFATAMNTLEDQMITKAKLLSREAHPMSYVESCTTADRSKLFESLTRVDLGVTHDCRMTGGWSGKNKFLVGIRHSGKLERSGSSWYATLVESVVQYDYKR